MVKAGYDKLFVCIACYIIYIFDSISDKIVIQTKT